MIGKIDSIIYCENYRCKVMSTEEKNNRQEKKHNLSRPTNNIRERGVPEKAP